MPRLRIGARTAFALAGWLLATSLPAFAADAPAPLLTKDGAPVFGAHIVAFNPADGSLVGNFSLNAQGEFVIAALSPGPYVIRVEPLDDADLESFFDASRSVDVDFRVTYFERLAIVPRGADTGTLDIHVVRK